MNKKNVNVRSWYVSYKSYAYDLSYKDKKRYHLIILIFSFIKSSPSFNERIVSFLISMSLSTLKISKNVSNTVLTIK